jgi:amino acid adenylation domain-containing protein
MNASVAGNGESMSSSAWHLSDAEREQVLRRFNDTAVPYPHDGLVHEIFAAHALRTPHAMAIKYADRHMTYAELNRRANQVAYALIARGVRPDDRVGLCIERSPELIIGMLGILKAGGGYVPIDPNYPTERLAFMVADSLPLVVLVTPDLLDRAAGLQAPTLVLDENLLSGPDDDPHVANLTSRNLAYVVYTSGSTGVPKGAMLEHRSLLRLVINPLYATVGPADCVAHCASPSFDAAIWEVWAPLLNGARLLIVPQCVVMNPVALNRTLVENQVVALLLTAGLFNEYADALEEAFGGLRFLLTGGDVMNPAVAARVLAKASRPQQLINAYGPSEATTFATICVLEAVEPGTRAISIGRPVANTQIYILDPERAPLPIGAVGEIYIGGPGVARGYINRPELCAERFVVDPFADEVDAKLYRTGDLGRWRADGSIDYLGRNDCQVKIRGFRVEPGEIEARLSACSGVRDVVVIALGEQSNERKLVAYLTATEPQALSPLALRAYAASVLPDYMVPNAYVIVSKLPLTANGKVDRRALPAPDEAAIVMHEFEAPRGDSECAVARAWMDVLGLSRVSRHDHFFELGGDSLQAMKLVVRLSQELQIDFPFHAVFEHSSVAQMGAYVDACLEPGAGQ